MKTKTVSKPLAAAVALALFGAAPVAEQMFTDQGLDLGGSVAAASQGHGQGGAGKGKGGAGGQGAGSQGAGGQGTGGPQYKGGRSGTSSVSAADEGDTSDGRGPKYMGGDQSNKPGDGDRGGKPAWAQEGLPDVELGRMNVSRAPDHVMERQFWEALNTWDPSMESFYELTAEAAATLLSTQYDSVVRFDSPLMNLALYKDLLVDGVTQLPGVTPASVNDLAAILLGSASDKTVSITTDTVVALNTIMDLSMSEADIAIVAEKAEVVRDAINTGHD